MTSQGAQVGSVNECGLKVQSGIARRVSWGHLHVEAENETKQQADLAQFSLRSVHSYPWIKGSFVSNFEYQRVIGDKPIRKRRLRGYGEYLKLVAISPKVRSRY